jgi:LysM repeat protein
MFQPSCQTADKKKGSGTEIGNLPDETPLDGFNQGSEPEGKPVEETFVSPTRPQPGEIIVPGNEIIVPQPLPREDPLSPVVDAPTIPLRPSDMNIYNVVRGDTLWGIARKNSISLNSLLGSNPKLSKSSKLSIGQEIMIPSGAAVSSSVTPIPQVSEKGISSGSYVVKSGDSLSRIARNNQVSLASLMELNGMNSQSIIRPGQTLLIPSESSAVIAINPSPIVPSGATAHVVKKGENLTRISSIYGVPIQQIMEWNNLSDPGKIRVGQSLVVAGPNSNEPTLEVRPVDQQSGNSTPVSNEDGTDDSLQNFFKGTVEDRPLIDAPDNP